jgi:type II secretion system protein G
MKNKNQSGFTLIELLVVVAIIGLLSSIVLISLNVARSRARDAKRIADISQVGKALEVYYNDNSGYPAALTGLQSPVVYMGALPVAPTPPDNPIGGSACTDANNAYVYTPASDSTTYTITFCLGGQTGSYAAGTHTYTPSGVQ